jgi:hypothetical protein
MTTKKVTTEGSTKGKAEGGAGEEDSTSMCAASNIFRVTVKSSDADGRWLGTVAISPGPVVPRGLAAVRTPGGYLRLRRIYYYRKDGREFVRLVSVLKKDKDIHYPLSEVKIEGTVIHVVKAEESCEDCDAAEKRERRKSKRAVKRLERAVRDIARHGVDELDWPEYIDGRDA